MTGPIRSSRFFHSLSVCRLSSGNQACEEFQYLIAAERAAYIAGLRERRHSRMNSKTIGRIDTTIIPRMTFEKCPLTHGALAKV